MIIKIILITVVKIKLQFGKMVVFAAVWAGDCRFFETSAKTGENARSTLLEAAKLLYKDYLKAKQFLADNGQNDDNQKGDRLIKKTDDKAKGKKGCC